MRLLSIRAGRPQEVISIRSDLTVVGKMES